MLNDLSTSDLFVLFAVLTVSSVIIGWLAEGILHTLAFGIFGNAALAFGGSSGAIVLLDMALKKRWIPPTFPVEPVMMWVAAAGLGGVAMILMPLLLRSAFIR